MDLASTRYRNGKSLARIADDLDFAAGTISTALQRHGVPRRDTPRTPTMTPPDPIHSAGAASAMRSHDRFAGHRLSTDQRSTCVDNFRRCKPRHLSTCPNRRCSISQVAFVLSPRICNRRI
ncbi:hypothetical protein ABZ955_37475 [Nocardia iowensis]